MEDDQKFLRNEKKSHKQLLELQSSILGAIPHAVVGLKNRTIIFANDAFEIVFGWKADEIIGRKTRVLYRNEKDYEEIGRRFYTLLEKQRTHTEDFPCKRKDGRELLCRMSASVIGKELREKNIVIMYEDITEFKKTEEELNRHREHLEELVKERTQQLEILNRELEASNVKLQAFDRLKSMFIASMSHELRTPLNSIIGFTGMTLQGLSGELNDEQMDNLSRSYQSAKHLLSLITDVIDISKIEAGRIDAFSEEVFLNEVLAEAIGNVKPQVKEKRLALVVEVPVDVRLHTDRRRLLQCLLNFLSNAVKYSESGTITVVAGETDGQVEISVSDTGIGIAENDMPKLFEAFERLDTHLRVKAGGTGLGLYLTKKIAMDILHGDVAVRSKEGEGSTFTLRVPKDLHPLGISSISNKQEISDENSADYRG